MSDTQLVTNRKARFQYEILETYETGIVLTGTEVKSLRDHGGQLDEAYVKCIKNEIWLVGAHISHYSFGNLNNHQERRDRKLLMHKKEIIRLKMAIQEKGLTLIPLGLYLKQGKIKMKIATAKGKKLHDKRQTIKERDEKRQINRAMKSI